VKKSPFDHAGAMSDVPERAGTELQAVFAIRLHAAAAAYSAERSSVLVKAQTVRAR
jgi:hypothetical protein